MSPPLREFWVNIECHMIEQTILTDYELYALTLLANGKKLEGVCHYLRSKGTFRRINLAKSHLERKVPQKLGVDTLYQSIAVLVSRGIIEVYDIEQSEQGYKQIEYRDALLAYFSLPPRSQNLLKLLGQEKTNSEICKIMKIKDGTLRGYLKELYVRLDIYQLDPSNSQEKRQKARDIAKIIMPELLSEVPLEIITSSNLNNHIHDRGIKSLNSSPALNIEHKLENIDALCKKFDHSFGAVLRLFRTRCMVEQDIMTLQQFSQELYLSSGIIYSVSTISKWENDKAKIYHTNRGILLSIITIFYQYGGILNIHEANFLLYIGDYRILNREECLNIDPSWID